MHDAQTPSLEGPVQLNVVLSVVRDTAKTCFNVIVPTARTSQTSYKAVILMRFLIASMHATRPAHFLILTIFVAE